MKAFKLAASGNFLTPEGRLSYPYLFSPNPKAKTKDGKLKFQCSLLLPPDIDMSAVQPAIKQAALDEFGEKKMADTNFTKALRTPFLDAYEKSKGDEQFKGWHLIRCAGVNRPQVVDANGASVIEETEAYAGRWARFSVGIYAYDVDGNRGISFGLVNVQLLRHGDALAGGRADPSKEFEPVAGAAASTEGKGAAGLFD